MYGGKETDGLRAIANENAEEALAVDVQKFNAERQDYIEKNYVAAGETVSGYGYGGSESLTIFLENSRGDKFVRKILNEKFITAEWDRNGVDVMLPPCSKARSQANYLLSLPEGARPYFPRVLQAKEYDIQKEGEDYAEYLYDMTYVPGIEVSRFVREYKPSPRIVAMLYTVIFKVLRQKIHSQKRQPVRCETLEQSYFSKIEKRLGLCQRTAPVLFGDSLTKPGYIIVNGKLMRNVGLILDTLRRNTLYQQVLEPHFHSLVMGDTNTENIKIGNIDPLLLADPNAGFNDIPFDAESLELKFLDPRAIGFHVNGIDTGIDDPMYDNKPWHNSIGNYDHIHGEHFDLEYSSVKGIPSVDIEIHSASPYYESYLDIEKYFCPVMSNVWEVDDPDGDFRKNDPNWLVRYIFVMGTHFMAMPPFHFETAENGIFQDNAQTQKRALAIYVEGIKWLNDALDMLEGHTDEYLGIYVGDRYKTRSVHRILEKMRHVPSIDLAFEEY